MNLIRAMVLLLAMVVVTGAAVASPVTVNFSVLGINSIDITAPAGYTLGGVTFRYDNLGSAVDTAQIDASGVFGSTFGSFILDFAAPATALNFDFSLLGVSQSASDALSIVMKKNGVDVADMLAPASFVAYDPNNPALGGDAHGVMSYSGAAFDQALMFFSADAQFAGIDTLSYEPVPSNVPEPAGLICFTASLLGLPGWRLLGRRR